MGREHVKDFIRYSLEMSRHCILGNFSIFNDQITQKEEKFLETILIQYLMIHFKEMKESL